MSREGLETAAHINLAKPTMASNPWNQIRLLDSREMWDLMARILVSNCSPRMDKVDTALILNPLTDCMRSAGAVVEQLYTKKLKIRPCIGDFDCWSEGTLGECHFQDDMTDLIEKMARAETWVFGVPVYAKLPW